MFAEARQQPRPVDLLLAGANEVQDVSAVEALALHEKRLRPDHFLDGHQPHRKAQRFVPLRIRKPLVVDFRHAVAAGENDVDEELALASAVRLAEPVRKRELGRNPVFGEHVWSTLSQSAAPDEEIEVLRVSADAGVVDERVRAADKKIDVGFLKDLDDTLIEVGSVLAWGLNGRWRHALAEARRMP